MDIQSNSSNNPAGYIDVIDVDDEYESINQNKIQLSNSRSTITEQDIRTNHKVYTSKELVHAPPMPCGRIRNSNGVHTIGTDNSEPYKHTSFVKQETDMNPNDQFDFSEKTLKTDDSKLSNRLLCLIVLVSIGICATITIPVTVHLLKPNSQTLKDISWTTKSNKPGSHQSLTTSQPVTLVSSKPVTLVSSQPVTSVSSQPVTSVSSKPVTLVSSQPVTLVSSQPVTSVSSQSVTTVPDQTTVQSSSTTSSGNCTSSGRCHECTCSSSRCPVNGKLNKTIECHQTVLCSGACFSEVRGNDANKTHRGCASLQNDEWIEKSKIPGCYQIRSSYVCFCCGKYCNTKDMSPYTINQPSECYQEYSDTHNSC